MYYRHPTSQRERSLEVVRTQIVGFHYTRRASSIRTRVTLWYNIQSPACDYGGLQLNRFGLVTFTSVLMDTFTRVHYGIIGALIYPQITIMRMAGERESGRIVGVAESRLRLSLPRPSRRPYTLLPNSEKTPPPVPSTNPSDGQESRPASSPIGWIRSREPRPLTSFLAIAKKRRPPPLYYLPSTLF